jgi:hypothetical protein
MEMDYVTYAIVVPIFHVAVLFFKTIPGLVLSSKRRRFSAADSKNLKQNRPADPFKPTVCTI